MREAGVLSLAAFGDALNEFVLQTMADELEDPTFGLDDDFFEYGGHSIAATMAVVKIRRELGLDVPINAVHRFRSAREVSRFLLETHVDCPQEAAQIGEPRECELPGFQRAVWDAMQLAPDSGVYNVVVELDLRGPLRVESLKEAFEFASEQHIGGKLLVETDDKGEPRMREDSSNKIHFDVLPGDADVEVVFARAAGTPLDVRRGGSVQVILARTGPNSHQALILFPHLFFDGVAVQSYLATVASAYNANGGVRRSNFLEFAVRAAGAENSRAHQIRTSRLWFQQATSLDMESSGSYLSTTTDPIARPALSAAAARCGGTSFALVLAALAIIHHRISGEALTIATPMSQRLDTRADGDGHRVALAYVTIPVNLASTPRTVVADVMAELGRGLAAVPSPPEVAPALVVALENDLIADFSPHQIEVHQRHRHNGTAKFDLSLLVFDNERLGLHIDAEYKDASSESDDIAALLASLHSLVPMLGDFPSEPISSIPLPGPSSTLLGRSREEFPRMDSIPQVFDSVSSKNPEAPAVISTAGQLTYGELSRKALEVAHGIAALKSELSPGSIIGVLLDRGPEQLAAVLGVMKAGYCYTNLSKTDPLEAQVKRIRQIGVSHIISDVHQVLDGIRVLAFNDVVSAGTLHREPLELELGPRSLDEPATVCFSSGSVGTPKAIQISHGAIIASLTNQDFGDFCGQTRMLSAASLNWDGYILETWGPLLNGGACVVATDPIDVAGLAETVVTSSVNTAWLTSGLFNALVDTAPESLAGLTHVMIGGEAISLVHVRRHILRSSERGSRLTLLNGYGPSEATVFVSNHWLVGRDGTVDVRPEVGRPIAGTTVRVIDNLGHDLPAGFPGELTISGPRLALGYCNAPGATADRFRPDPHGGNGARRYHTGDRAKITRDGHIRLQGRLDKQIKIAGKIVDLAEVQRAAQTLVKEVLVVIARPANNHTHELVLCIVGAAPDFPDLQAELAEHIPEHMIPSRLVSLGELPLTRNGKVDEEKVNTLVEAQASIGAPEHGNSLETADQLIKRALVALLSAEVGSSIDEAQRFISQGGTSLGAIRAAADFVKFTGLKISASQILRSKSCADLAETVLGGTEASSIDRDRITLAMNIFAVPRALRSELARLAGS